MAINFSIGRHLIEMHGTSRLWPSVLLDLILAWAIVRIFALDGPMLLLKFMILLLYGVLKYIFTSTVDALNYRLAIKNAMADEMKHYLTVFNRNVNWDEVGTYDDFLLESAFNETLPTDLRVLAGLTTALWWTPWL